MHASSKPPSQFNLEEKASQPDLSTPYWPVKPAAISATRSHIFKLHAGRDQESFVQGISVSVHCDDGREIARFQVPHRFGNAQFLEQVLARPPGQAAGIILRRTPNRVKINCTKFLQRRQGL